MHTINPFSIFFFVMIIILVWIEARQNMRSEEEEESEIIDHIKHSKKKIETEEIINGPYGAIALKKELTSEEKSDSISS